MLAPAKIGIVGTGFIGLGLAVALESMKTLTLSAILTRRDTGSIDSRHRDKLTTSLNRLIDQSDLIVECTGDAIYATEIVDRVLSMLLVGLHVLNDLGFDIIKLVSRANGFTLKRTLSASGFQPKP